MHLFARRSSSLLRTSCRCRLFTSRVVFSQYLRATSLLTPSVTPIPTPIFPSRHRRISQVTRRLQVNSQTRRQARNMSSATSFFDFTPNDKKGQPYPLKNLNGKVVLVVNTASKCGFTPQFEGLEKLYKELKGGKSSAETGTEAKGSSSAADDFEIIGFPCNQFGGQDPGTDDEIQSFCQINYGVTFPVLQKVDVNGKSESEVFTWLKAEKPGIMGVKMIKWNFEKFLVGRDGKVKERWASTTKPEKLKAAIEKELAVLAPSTAPSAQST